METTTPVTVPSPIAGQGSALLPRITRDGLTIFKRYPGDHSAWYHKFTYQKKQHLWKLLPTVDESFSVARKKRKAVLESRFAALDDTKERRPSSTLGQVFTRYEEGARGVTGIGAKTVAHNVNAVRNIFRQVTTAVTNEQINQFPSTAFNPALLEKYKTLMLENAGEDRLAQDRASITANSTIKQARSLFCKKLPPQFYKDLILPEVSALRDVRLLPETGKGYKMPAPELIIKIRTGSADLKKVDTNAYIIYLLGLGAGLRAGEIGAARQHWLEDMVQDGKVVHGIRIQTETDFRPKGKQERFVPLNDDIHAELKQLMLTTLPGTEAYILRGSKTERTDQSFRRFSAWLVGLGWTRLKKAHELRKMFGSFVTHQAGLRAAKDTLGHSQQSTTDQYYAGQVNLPTYQIPALG